MLRCRTLLLPVMPRWDALSWWCALIHRATVWLQDPASRQKPRRPSSGVSSVFGRLTSRAASQDPLPAAVQAQAAAPAHPSRSGSTATFETGIRSGKGSQEEPAAAHTQEGSPVVQRAREVAAAARSDAAGDAAPAGPPAQPAAAGAGEAEGTGLLGRLRQSTAPGQGAGVCVCACTA